VIKITKAQSRHLNRKIEEVEDVERHDLFLVELGGTGKVIPYIGESWPDVDFTKPVSFGHCVNFVGFMENNKWGYPEWQLSEEQDNILKALLLDLDLDQDRDTIESNLQELYSHIQSCLPDGRDIGMEALVAASKIGDGHQSNWIESGVHARYE